MAKYYIFIPFLLLSFFLVSCAKKTGETVTVAVPITQSVADFRASVKVEEPQSIHESGKIYAYQDYIFVNDKNEGVHVIDNSDRFNPKNIQFLKIPRNTDVAVKDDKLYANNGMDLVVFDISDKDNIKETGRIEDVFPNYHQVVPEGVAYIDTQDFDPSQEVIIGYVMETKKIEYAMETIETGGVFFSENGALSNDVGSGSGTGGSFARFSILDNLLYIADEKKLSVLDITSGSKPSVLNSVSVGWDIETLFHYDGYMYMGSPRGLFIYSIEDPLNPQFASYVQHVMGCDPVVVKDDLAYVTIRGGNGCGQEFNQLDIVDISDKTNPSIIKTYEMSNPHGLGIKDDWLFVCDGSAGLKVYDIEETPDLRLIDQFSNINTYDVIPLEDKLLMIGDGILYQYSYKGNEINLLSSFALN
ncbi:MAG: hypothetical protein ABGW97_12705 [Christiangramia sp.]|uniref:LVIVD repeat-containing protein n=1 Tax=Christiangramia sp. TaxID=1931228 RepID=UPI003241C885